VELGDNLVVTHDRCNGAKSDHLPAPPHLERWARRNRELSYALSLVFEDTGTPYDPRISSRITRWAYRQVQDRKGLVWVKERLLIPLETGWQDLIDAA
jgi:hypothetical protein